MFNYVTTQNCDALVLHAWKRLFIHFVSTWFSRCSVESILPPQLHEQKCYYGMYCLCLTNI